MIEGKVVNQFPKIIKQFAGKDVTLCENCRKVLPFPRKSSLEDRESISKYRSIHVIFHYIYTKYWIYETKTGRSVVYCSEECRNKHNHRFSQKRGKNE